MSNEDNDDYPEDYDADDADNESLQDYDTGNGNSRDGGSSVRTRTTHQNSHYATFSFPSVARTSSMVTDLIDRYIVADTTPNGNVNPLHQAKEKLLSLLFAITPKNEKAQMVFGGLSGWVAGLLLMRIGKFAAFVIGAGLLTLQVIYYSGYVRIDWGKVNRNLSDRGSQYHRRTTLISALNQPSWSDFAEENKHISMGFAGGFFLGLAMA